MSPSTSAAFHLRGGRQPIDPELPPGKHTPQVLLTFGEGQRPALKATAARWAMTEAKLLRSILAWGLQRTDALVTTQPVVPAAPPEPAGRLYPVALSHTMTAEIDEQARRALPPLPPGGHQPHRVRPRRDPAATANAGAARPDRSGLARRHVAAFLTGRAAARLTTPGGPGAAGWKEVLDTIVDLSAQPEFASIHLTVDTDGDRPAAEATLVADTGAPTALAGVSGRAAWDHLVNHLHQLVARPTAAELGVHLEVDSPYRPPEHVVPEGLEVLTADQCAAAWRIELGTWRYYVRRGYAPQPLPSYRVRGRKVWDAETVRNYPRPGAGARTDLTRARAAQES